MTTDTRQAIMDAAQPMVQAHGYGALSFRELAKAVGVKSASVHYHFPTKGDLGAALARRYTDAVIAHFDAALAVDFPDPQTCIRDYAGVFRGVLQNNNRMCLCGILAAERDELPPEVRAEVDRFIEANVQWLFKVLSLRKSDADKETLQRRALAIYAAVGGAQLVARGRGDISLFDETIEAYRTAGLIP